MAFFFIDAVTAAYGSDVPPGCNPATKGFIGGCTGKSQIEDIKLLGPDCLSVNVNNCNGGVVEVYNTCAKKLNLGNITIAARKSNGELPISVELEKDASGKIIIKESRGNSASYTPKETEEFFIDGDMEGQKVKLSYVKTKQLCE